MRQGGRSVSPTDIQDALDAGADRKAIHDTVLIATAFSMYNRQVDGLGTWAPDDPGGLRRDRHATRDPGLRTSSRVVATDRKEREVDRSVPSENHVRKPFL